MMPGLTAAKVSRAASMARERAMAMSFEDELKDYKLVAPDVDALLRFFDRRDTNPTAPSPLLLVALGPLFEALSPLAPLDKDGEAKAVWLRIPRGTIEDYDTFEDMRQWGEVESYEEYEARWLEEYPEELSWYRLVAVQSFEPDGKLRYVGIGLGNETIVSMLMGERSPYDQMGRYEEAAACRLCSLILPAVRESMALLAGGSYNQMVATSLPYQFRVGVIRRRDLWEAEPDVRVGDYDGLSEESVRAFRELVESGVNSSDKIGRIRDFTANDFFRACRLGYESVGKECGHLEPSELYLRYADGRDEGLTGKGHGLNEGSGIDFDDSKAWDEWYFRRPQRGGHPWEVVPGGNSTHVELYVSHDQRKLEWRFRLGEITEEEYERGLEDAGYYFVIAGKHRQFEAVGFYLALSRAGLPVVIRDAEQLLARLDGTDWIGVVPHHVFPRYCEGLFPDEYGKIIDFTHAFKGEDTWFDQIVWLPEEEADIARPSAGCA